MALDYYRAVQPPSTGSEIPVVKGEESERRKRVAATTSEMLPKP
jgi:hypothetical protein